MNYTNNGSHFETSSEYNRGRTQTAVRRAGQVQLQAYTWFFAAAVTLLMSMAVARLIA